MTVNVKEFKVLQIITSWLFWGRKRLICHRRWPQIQKFHHKTLREKDWHLHKFELHICRFLIIEISQTDTYSAHIRRNLWHTTICRFLMIEIWKSDRFKPTSLKFQTKEVNESMLMLLLAKSSAICMSYGSKIIYHAASICERISYAQVQCFPSSDPAFT